VTGSKQVSMSVMFCIEHAYNHLFAFLCELRGSSSNQECCCVSCHAVYELCVIIWFVG